MFEAIKTVHVTTVAITAALFLIRALASLRRPYAQLPIALRVLPHVNDTALLASAIWLAWASHQLPWEQAWLAAKIGALCAYIAAGSWTLKHARGPAQTLGGLTGCMALLAYIVGAALQRSAWSWLA